MVRGRRATSLGGRGEGSGRRFTTFSTPPPTAGGLTTSAPLLAAVGYYKLIRIVHDDDETSHHEGEGSYNETMRAVWINEGNKIEPVQASQFITKTLQAHFPSPIHRFSNFSMDVQDLLYDMFMRNHQFTEHSDDLRARSAWTTTESYSRGMDERYGDDSQRPELDPDIWVAASGAPKKGHLYGFGHSLGTARVISLCSSSVSHATSPFTTPTASGDSSSAAPTMTLDQFREIVNETFSQNISTIVSQTIS
ncbi:hypothetical protein Taro_055961 [Colocasia esculenta]|uniref:Uncharacterized protein n=1 Tax=Colocasia esculenta TaxID=4460 RepID=A0A843XUX4_COLES|nr:hypothetical protein [Colocasia esculenta]